MNPDIRYLRKSSVTGKSTTSSAKVRKTRQECSVTAAHSAISSFTNPAYEDIKKINATISKIADGKKIIYIDIGDKLVEKDGSLSRSVFPDRLHIAAKAYGVWADAITPLVQKMTEQ
jgi:lysophospholipase L1-like esterase